MTSLRAGRVEVARYGWDVDPPASAVPRPALHPVRTLGGTVVSAAHPADHPWHRGMGIALPDVAGVNLWGGPTYQAGSGYRETELGQVRQASPRQAGRHEVTDSLTWCDARGRPLLHESRQVAARSPRGDGWTLAWTTVLTTAGELPVRLASPGSSGRSGAGYGGFFWRLPACDPAEVRVFTADAEGEDAVNGARASWLAISVRGPGGRVWSAVLAPADERTAADPWFVRVGEYLGIGSSLAGERRLVLDAGTSLRIAMNVVLLDRPCDRTSVAAILADCALEPSGTRP